MHEPNNLILSEGALGLGRLNGNQLLREERRGLGRVNSRLALDGTNRILEWRSHMHSVPSLERTVHEAALYR